MPSKRYSMEDSELMAKNAHEHGLNVSEFAGISALRGRQFGREIYTALVPFRDLQDFLKVFPEVQRGVSKSKVNSVRKYVLSSLNDQFAMRFFSSITATARGGMFYDEVTHRVAINTKESRLSINDGQHRFYGVSEAIRTIRGMINKSKDKDERISLTNNLKTLEEMVIPLVIFNQISEREEKQLFHDLNNLAQRPTRSATIKLAQTDNTAVMARELSTENKYLHAAGVEMDKNFIKGDNPNKVLLTTVYQTIRALLKDQLAGKREISRSNYDQYKSYVDKSITEIFHALPDDILSHNSSMLRRASTLRTLATFVYKGRNVYKFEDATIFDAIRGVNWYEEIDFWQSYGGYISRTGSLSLGNGKNNDQNIMSALLDQLSEEDRAKTEEIDSLDGRGRHWKALEEAVKNK